MVKFLKLILLAAAGFLTMAAGSCSQSQTDDAIHYPLATVTEAQPWIESSRLFFTKDVVRAQKEIPFTIVLPRYVPTGPRGVPSPEIVGPLREYQREGRVDIQILYIVVPGEERPATIEITEANYRYLPPPPELNPDLVYAEIRGKRLVKEEGNFGPGPGVVYYFSRDPIYFIVRLYNLPADEAPKVVESMLE